MVEQPNPTSRICLVHYANNVSGSGDIEKDGQGAGALSPEITTAAPAAPVTFIVKVVNSGGNKYVIDDETAPVLVLEPGKTYVFDVSDGSVAGHPLAFKDGQGNSYTTGVTSRWNPWAD